MPTNKILIVDDEVKSCEMIGKFLTAKGYSVAVANDGLAALGQCADFRPDVVLLDIKMPNMGGVECLRRIKDEFPLTEVIMVTAVGDLETGIACMKGGAFGYLNKPVNFENLLMDVGRALERQRLVIENKDYQENLEAKVEERTREVRKLNEKLRDSFLNSVRISMGVVENFDPFLGGHCKRVAWLANEMAALLEFSRQELFDMELAGLLHEVGVVAVPESLRNRPFAELEPEEIALVKQYPVFSQKILAPSAELDKAGLIIRSHLERLDGSGFPDGLEGESIPRASRILGVVNAYDELLHRRRFSEENFPSRRIAEDFAFNNLYKQAGRYYEKEIIETLEKALRKAALRSRSRVISSFEELRPGMVLAADLCSKEGKLLIGEGNALSEAQVFKIKNLYKMKLLQQKIYVYE